MIFQPRKTATRGFTLVEAAVVLIIVGVVLGIGVPSYNKFQQRQQLRAAGEALMQDLRNAREMSVTARTPIFVSYSAGEKKWCWGVSRGQACDCASPSPLMACNITRGDSASYPHVILDIAQDQAFAPGTGQVNQAGAAALRTTGGLNLRVVLNPMGRASVCGQDSPKGMPC